MAKIAQEQMELMKTALSLLLEAAHSKEKRGPQQPQPGWENQAFE